MVGQVTASDADEGQNGELRFALTQSIDFTIDSSSGVLRTTQALDFEQDHQHQLVVTATDQGSPSRQTSTLITVYVNDLQDELPRFFSTSHDVHVQENRGNSLLWKLHAVDADEQPQITYTMVEGNSQLFTLNPQNGQVRTAPSGLDFERQQTHRLVFGTLENPSADQEARFVLVIHVQDVNDHPPQFDLLPLPVRLGDGVPVGSYVGRVHATDRDGSTPNNLITYELLRHGKEFTYFHVDTQSGQITVKADLRSELESDFRVSNPRIVFKKEI